MKKLLSLVLAVAMLVSMAAVANAAPITDFDDYQTTANEIETFCIQNSQSARDLNVLSNCIDGLLTNDNHGSLQPAARHRQVLEYRRRRQDLGIQPARRCVLG